MVSVRILYWKLLSFVVTKYLLKILWDYANVLFLLKPLPTHFGIHCESCLCCQLLLWWSNGDFLFLSFYIYWLEFFCKKGISTSGFVFFNYSKIFRISTNLELKDVNLIKLIPNTNIRERKTKLVTCFRKYNELMKKSSIYDLWIWFSFWLSIDSRLNSKFSWYFTSGLL